MAEIQINPWVGAQWRFAGYVEDGVEVINGKVMGNVTQPPRGLCYQLISAETNTVVRELWRCDLTMYSSSDAVQITGMRPLYEDGSAAPTGEFVMETWFVDNPYPAL